MPPRPRENRGFANTPPSAVQQRETRAKCSKVAPAARNRPLRRQSPSCTFACDRRASMHSPINRDGLLTGRLLRILCLLWLAGVAMRMTLLAVPPVIPLVHEELHLSETQVGLL